MKKLAPALIVGAAVISLGTLTACSGNTVREAPAVSTTTVAAMPSSATFIADMPGNDGAPMTMAIVVENEKVVAYATDGSDDEARFVGTHKDGQLELMSEYGDTLKASFDGAMVNGEVTMNETDGGPVRFAAASVQAPAGLYSAAAGNMRAAWVVRPDRTMVGVMNLDTRGHSTVADARRANDRAFMERVRQMRLNRQLQAAPQMAHGTFSMTMGGTPVTAVRMTGDMAF